MEKDENRAESRQAEAAKAQAQAQVQPGSGGERGDERGGSEQNRGESYVAYYRVSTARQSLGLEAQRSIVLASVPRERVIAEFVERESGAHDSRPRLAAAMAVVRQRGAVLLVAKADRLSRDLSFASKVFFHSGIRVRALDMPADAQDNAMIFAVYYGLAQHERQLISQRTRAALAVKRRELAAVGRKLGNPVKQSFTPDELARSRETRMRQSLENENNVRSANEIRLWLSRGGGRSYSAIARHLASCGCYTSRGVPHTPWSVTLLMRRFGL